MRLSISRDYIPSFTWADFAETHARRYIESGSNEVLHIVLLEAIRTNDKILFGKIYRDIWLKISLKRTHYLFHYASHRMQ